MKLQLYDVAIPAGFPSPAADYIVKEIDLNEYLMPHPSSTFLIKCEGESMIDACIPDKAILIVDKSITPQNGDIVVAVINGNFTVKYLQINPHRCRLLPANNRNKKFKELEITPEMDFTVWGVVTYVIHDPKQMRHVCFG